VPNPPVLTAPIPPPLVVPLPSTPRLWQALPSSQPFGAHPQVVDQPTLPDSMCQHLALYPPCCAGPTEHADTPSPSVRLTQPYVSKSVVSLRTTTLEEGLMSGDLPSIQPYASQSLHSTSRLPISSIIRLPYAIVSTSGTTRLPLSTVMSHHTLIYL
jgi:hypothetical protein